MFDSNYFSVHLPPDSRRSLVWEEIALFFEPRLPNPTNQVVELGAGYCAWINSTTASERFAVDVSQIINSFASKGVTPIIGTATDLHFFENENTDVVLVSNLLEHLTREDVKITLNEIWRILRPGGRLFIVQPNFRFAWREYFDDYTHQTIFTDQGLCELLKTIDFTIINCWPRFTPLSFKSVRFSIPRFLIRLYLRLPWRPRAKQMAIIVEKPTT